MNSVEFSQKLRLAALRMTSLGGSSHVGSVFSMADILAVLYSSFMKFDSSNPVLSDRDRFILSKGHSGAGVYAALAYSGFFDVSLLDNHYQNGSIFSGHVSHKGVPGVEFSTGSLGHGLAVACGMAYAAKLSNSSHKILCLMSDGECDEGSNWESFLFASHHNLDNLIAIVDFNGLQSIRSTSDTLNLSPFDKKMEAFNWDVVTIDGHSHSEILTALKSDHVGRPKMIIAKTVKGKGVSFMENNVLWHYRSPKGQEFIDAFDELANEK